MMRVVTFNGWVGQEHAELTNNLCQLVGDLYAPEVLALQEVTGWRGDVPGYRRVVCQHHAFRDASSSQILVRRAGVSLTGRACVHVGGPHWSGPHGEVHPPRIYPAVRVKIGPDAYRILDVHRAPVRTRNPGAWDAEHAAIVRWSRRHAMPRIMAGDWNTGPSALAELAQQCRTPNRQLRGVDGFLSSPTIAGTVRRLPDHYGSDAHRPTILTIRETR